MAKTASLNLRDTFGGDITMFEWFNSSFDESTFSFVGVTSDNSNNPIFYYSVLAKTLPEYVDKHSVFSTIRKFANDEKLLEDGSISTNCDESKSINLDGYTAYWMPKMDFVFTNLMRSFYEKNTKDKVLNK